MRRLAGSSRRRLTAHEARGRSSAALKTAVLSLVAFLGSLPIGVAAATEPVYWRQRLFFIPYQASANPSRDRLEKVDLLVSRDGSANWSVLQQAQPHVRGFSYHAPADGQYAFSLRASDARGVAAPLSNIEPQLQIVVDTQPPTLQLGAQLDAAGKVVVRYEARDLYLKPETLRLEVQTDGKTWHATPLGPPDLSQPDRLLGQLPWKPPLSASDVRFRATIEDRAGNQVTSSAQTSLVGPLLSPAAGPGLGAPPSGAALFNSTAGNAGAPSMPNRPVFDAPASVSIAPPPLENPYTDRSGSPAPLVASSPQRMHAQLVADTGTPAASMPPLPPMASAAADSPPPLFDAPPGNVASGNAAPVAANHDWGSQGAQPSQEPPAAQIRWVNSLTFDIDYELQTVGPWGVEKVELWATRNNGQAWNSFGTDADNRGPMRVSAPDAGVYGFRLVVSGANGAAVATPRPGDSPELTIGIDLEAPRAELQAAQIGQAELADHLVIRWAASDENLDARPVGLFFSGQPDGPWTMIATDLDNSGQYAWRLLRQVPEKLYLRLEVRDKAGNVTARQSAAPVSLNLPQPTGRFRNVRPVSDEPGRYRTAAGGR